MNEKIVCNSWFGDYDDCIVNLTITFDSGKSKTENRMGKASKKGIFNTSMYGIKCQVDLNTKEVTIK